MLDGLDVPPRAYRIREIKAVPGQGLCQCDHGGLLWCETVWLGRRRSVSKAARGRIENGGSEYGG